MENKEFDVRASVHLLTHYAQLLCASKNVEEAKQNFEEAKNTLLEMFSYNLKRIEKFDNK